MPTDTMPPPTTATAIHTATPRFIATPRVTATPTPRVIATATPLVFILMLRIGDTGGGTTADKSELAIFRVRSDHLEEDRRAHGWPWGSAAVVPVAAVATALVGSVCIITTHRRCLATRSIRRRLGPGAQI